MVCVSLGHLDTNSLIETLKTTPFAEIRLDRMKLMQDEVRHIFSMPASLIATFRPGSEDNRKRQSLLETAIEAGAAYVDIEIDAKRDFRRAIMEKATEYRCTFIVSYHNFSSTPDRKELVNIVEQSFTHGASIAKVATMAQTMEDCARLLALYGDKRYAGRLVVVGMGPVGRITRIAAPFLGCPFTYAYHAGDPSTASGQFEYNTVKTILEVIQNG